MAITSVSKEGLFAAVATVVLAVGVPARPASALAVDLGAASNWAVLEIGTGQVFSANVGPGGLVVGDVGIGAGDQFNQIMSSTVGDVYLASGATYNQGLMGNVTGSILNNQSAVLTQSANAANLASAAASSLSLGTPSSLLSLTNQSSILNPGVYNLSDLRLTNSVLTLSGVGDYTFNVSGQMYLSGSQVSLASGATAGNVLFNVTGNTGVSEFASILQGSILAPNASVQVSSSYVVGEIIAGGNISLAPGAVVGNVHPAPGPIVGAGLPGLVVLGSSFLLAWRLRRRALGGAALASA